MVPKVQSYLPQYQAKMPRWKWSVWSPIGKKMYENYMIPEKKTNIFTSPEFSKQPQRTLESIE